jgi:predicted transcriptional regulator
VTKTQTVSARLPRDLVEKLDRTAQSATRNRTQQLEHFLRGCLTAADSAAPPTHARTSREETK